MKKFLVVIAIVAAAALGGHADVTFAADQGDLCGGTGGNGEIISIGSNTFTLKLNEDGEKGDGDLIVSLAKRSTIETPTGFASLSDLKTGDRVTLVGDNHRDGTFTADAVVVCSGTEALGADSTSSLQADQTTPITVRNKNSETYEKVHGIANAITMLLVGSVWLGTLLFLRLKKKKSLVYLLFFTIFYIYLYKVLDYTILQFQSLLLLQHFVPDLMLNGFKDGTNVNLVPLATLTFEDAKTSFLNILMMVPFGFGLPFITNFRIRNIVIAGLFASIVIEFLQLVTGFMAHTTFRVADINDLIFNTLGVALGYILFAQFVLIFRRIFSNWKTLSNPVLRYIGRRPQVDETQL